jgi:hypothetical protein
LNCAVGVGLRVRGGAPLPALVRGVLGGGGGWWS